MDKALYDDVVRFLQDGSYPSGNNRRRFLVRHRAKRYTLYGRRLRLGSRIVLHKEEAFCALRSLHLRKEHLRGPAFSAAVQKIYVVNRVTVLCLEVVRCCDHCSGTYTHTRESGPLIHYSVRQRKGLCRKIGIPFVRDVGLTDAPELDPSRFRPLTVDLAGPWNCFCAVFSYILSGTCKNIAVIEEWVRKIRCGPHSSLYKTFGAQVPESLDDTSYLTRTDVKIIARELKINLFEYFPASGRQRARWDSYSGNKKGADRGGVYFAWTIRNGQGNSLLVDGLEPLGE